MKFFVLGLNHKDCPVEVREKIHFTAKDAALALDAMKADVSVAELVLLSTCNRVEFYGFAASPEAAAESLVRLIEQTHGLTRDQFSSYLFQLEGKPALFHLFRVAAGLESLVLGENEILGQLRDAFRLATASGTVHSFLYRLMEKALKLGKDVRTETKINEGAVSVSSAAVELAEKIFGHLSGQKLIVIGTGEMSVLTLKSLKAAGAEVSCVVSRNQERGQELALEYGAEWATLETWEPFLAAADILITSTAAPHPIVHADQVKRVMAARRHRPLFLIDIAVPRDVEATVNSLDDVYLYNIDDLKEIAAANVRLRKREIHSAEVFIEKAVLDYQGWMERLKARPVLERFESFIDEVLAEEFTRFAKRHALDPQAQEEFRSRLRAKLLHFPQERIREASLNGGVQRYLEALHSLFDLEKTDRRPKTED